MIGFVMSIYVWVGIVRVEALIGLLTATPTYITPQQFTNDMYREFLETLKNRTALIVTGAIFIVSANLYITICRFLFLYCLFIYPKWCSTL